MSHEWGSWGWLSSHIRDVGVGIAGTGGTIMTLSLTAPEDHEIRKTMLTVGGTGALVGGVIYLIGKIGQGNNNL